MIVSNTGLTNKEKSEVEKTLSKLIDLYRDFYLTKNNIRFFIKENIETLFDCLKAGDKIAFDANGVIVITGFSDKANRKYVKILAEDNAVAKRLLKIISDNLEIDLYTKIKRNNPIQEMLLENGFKVVAGRGKEFLLVRKVKSIRRK